MSSTRKNTKAKPSKRKPAPGSPFVSTPIPDIVRETNIRMKKIDDAIAEAIAKIEQQEYQIYARLKEIWQTIVKMGKLVEGLMPEVHHQQEDIAKEPKQQLRTPSPSPTVTIADDPNPWAFFEAPLNSLPPHVTRRLPDGRINLDLAYLDLLTRTPQERYVMTAWPDVALPARVEKLQDLCQDTNTVEIPANLRLVWADKTTLDKLDEIQRELQRALVPYNRWPMRVACELKQDFGAVATFIQNWNPDWVTVVEAILQVLSDHRVIDLPPRVMRDM
ncbi:hypothetical protein F4811DRAFT_525823 [Daldinia bambusicola]|nr:hypothetical protein F4811DRAFT_525823 [Daldinia bambusicola]